MGDFGVAALSLAACVFGASAAAKLRSAKAYRFFRDGLRGTKLLPRRLLPVGAAALSSAEAVIAAGLLAAAVQTTVAAPGAILVAEFALAAAALLTLVLATGVAMVIRRGIEAPCACFGANSDRPLGRAQLVRNLSLLAVICAGLAAVPLAHGRPVMSGAVLGAIAGAVAALLFIRWDDLAQLFTSSAGAATAVERASWRRY